MLGWRGAEGSPPSSAQSWLSTQGSRLVGSGDPRRCRAPDPRWQCARALPASRSSPCTVRLEAEGIMHGIWYTDVQLSQPQPNALPQHSLASDSNIQPPPPRIPSSSKTRQDHGPKLTQALKPRPPTGSNKNKWELKRPFFSKPLPQGPTQKDVSLMGRQKDG